FLILSLYPFFLFFLLGVGYIIPYMYNKSLMLNLILLTTILLFTLHYYGSF
ncbi:hypothetical protein PPACK8108_LOCUS19558, partial [Phakopsora pachyrhizi]